MSAGKTSLCAFALASIFAGGASAQSCDNASLALRQSAAASQAASAGVIYGVAASGQAALAVSAVPLTMSGHVAHAIGAVSLRAGAASMRAANARPLPVADRTFTVVSPDQALQR